jgi:hypothetical protein
MSESSLLSLGTRDCVQGLGLRAVSRYGGGTLTGRCPTPLRGAGDSSKNTYRQEVEKEALSAN